MDSIPRQLGEAWPKRPGGGAVPREGGPSLQLVVSGSCNCDVSPEWKPLNDWEGGADFCKAQAPAAHTRACTQDVTTQTTAELGRGRAANKNRNLFLTTL